MVIESRDPRVVIVLFAAIIASTFLIRNPFGLVLLLLCLLGVYGLAGGDGRRLRRTTRNLGFFIAIVVGINAVLVDGTPLRGPLFFMSQEGFARGVFYGLRVLVIYVTLLVLHVSASPESLARGMAALIKPLSPSLSRRVALYGLLAMGFFPLFADEVERVRIAQRFRGGGMEGGISRRVMGARALIVPLFVSAIHRSGQLVMAVELRKIQATIERILVLERPTRWDYASAITALIVLTLAIIV